ncbi:MAG: hypothetical protein K2R98_01420 [Gemmataceae bacterium]|nr:hypothetical protein [Gemmataceae bacterium]
MYPLKVILIGCLDRVRVDVRQVLSNRLAVVETEYGDLAVALQQSLNTDAQDKRLFIVYLRSDADLQNLKRLYTALGDQPILGLRDENSDIRLFSSAMRSGAAFVVSLPLAGDDLTIALNWIARQYGHTVREAPVIAVSGVTGGCGATVLALNLAREIGHRRKRRCVLMELSLKMGAVATYLNVEPRFTSDDLLGQLEGLDIEAVRPALTPAAENLDILAGPQQQIKPLTATWENVSRIVNHLRMLADVVVLDVPCTYDDLQFDALAAAQYAVLAAEQKVPSIRALQMVRQALLQKAVQGEFVYVINRYDPRAKSFSVAELEALLHVTQIHTIANDPAVATAVNQGHLLRDGAPGSRALADIEALAARLAPGSPGKSDSKSSVFGRLVRSFGLT